MQSSPIRIVAVVGSARPGSFTRRALDLVLDEFAKDPNVEVDVIEPEAFPLVLPGTAEAHSLETQLMARVEPAHGVLLSTPEYHGSYSSTIKVLVDNMGYPSALAGKPVALIGVAAGRTGAVKALDHLRSVCAHVGAMVLPYPISVACVDTVLDDSGECSDPELEEQLRAVGGRLVDYIRGRIAVHEDASKFSGET